MFKSRLAGAPQEILNWRLWYGVLVFGLMGAARGLDEGLIGTTASLPIFQQQFGLKDKSLSKQEQADLLSNITSMVQMGSILGAMIGFYMTDKLGRLWATRQLCVIWAVGMSVFLGAAAHGSLGMVYAGRFIAGIGIGQTTVVAPTYLAEIAPKHVRGLCVCIFSGNVYFGVMLGYFAVYGSTLHISASNSFQWVNPNLLHIYFSVLIAALSFFAIESPRWLVKIGKHDEATAALSKLRNLSSDHWFIQSELLDINEQLDREREATLGTTWFGPVRELFTLSSNRYRLMLSIGVQALGQWSGASSITIYATQYFAAVGISGSQEKLFATAIFGLVKFLSALLCAFFLIDLIGRKRSLLTGISLQFVAMLYMGIFLLIDQGIAKTNATQSPSQHRAGIGAIVMIYLSGFGWALGWNSCQYLVNAEMYPLRLRALGGSFAMTFHFLNQYGNSKAVPEMFLQLGVGGTMMFFACVTAIGGVWAWFFLPELANKSLESVDAVFALPWHRIGRQGKALTQNMGGVVDMIGADKEKMEMVENVERVDEDRRV